MMSGAIAHFSYQWRSSSLQQQRNSIPPLDSIVRWLKGVESARAHADLLLGELTNEKIGKKKTVFSLFRKSDRRTNKIFNV